MHTLKKTGNAERLYIVFIELFADKWQLPLASITTYSIHERLHDIGMHTEQLEQWDAFFTAVSEQAFGASRTEEEIQNVSLEHLKELMDAIMDLHKLKAGDNKTEIMKNAIKARQTQAKVTGTQ